MKLLSKIAAILAAVSVLSAPVYAATPAWIVIGDSIVANLPGKTAGVQGTANQSALYLLATEKNLMIRNYSAGGNSLGNSGASGYNSTEMPNTIKRMGGMFADYSGIIVQAGTNDFARSVPWTETVTSLRRILLEAQTAGKKTMVLDPLWRADEDTPNGQGIVLNYYRYMMFTVCETEFPTSCHFAHRANTVLGSSAAAALYYDSVETANGTQLHFNAAGHRKLADWIKLEAASAGYF